MKNKLVPYTRDIPDPEQIFVNDENLFKISEFQAKM